MRIRTVILGLALLVAVTGCGPGTPGPDNPPPPDPEWAYGWWMDAGGLQDHLEWGAYIAQLEIRPDGTVLQMVDYCDGPDWQAEGRWELQEGGAVRLVPVAGDEVVPFQFPSQEFRHVDLRPGDGACQLSAVRVSQFDGDEFPPIFLERGRWCMGEVLPEFNDCAPQKYCGEDAPVCE
jgi:hypothetical protein